MKHELCKRISNSVLSIRVTSKLADSEKQGSNGVLFGIVFLFDFEL